MLHTKFSLDCPHSTCDEDEYTWHTKNLVHIGPIVIEMKMNIHDIPWMTNREWWTLDRDWQQWITWVGREIVTLDDFFWIPGSSMRFIAMSLDVKINWFILVSDFGVLVIGPWSTWCTGLNSVVHVYSRVNQKNNFYPVKTNSSCCSLTPDWCPHTHYR